MNTGGLPPTTPDALEQVFVLEAQMSAMKQIPITTEHVLHGGVYTRTIKIPAGVMITGALIKIATTLTISGQADLIVGEGEKIGVDGFAVLPAEKNRKTVFLAKTDTFVSMAFATTAQTVEVAEREFTDETDKLKSHDNLNVVTVTGE